MGTYFYMAQVFSKCCQLMDQAAICLKLAGMIFVLMPHVSDADIQAVGILTPESFKAISAATYCLPGTWRMS